MDDKSWSFSFIRKIQAGNKIPVFFYVTKQVTVLHHLCKTKTEEKVDLEMANVKINGCEATWITVVNSTGVSKKSIADRYNYKYMDVINVLRGNAFSSVTGILNHNITKEEVTVIKFLLKQDHAYRDIAQYAGVDANKVRNIMGHLQYEKVVNTDWLLV